DTAQELKWVRILEQDTVGAQVVPGGILAVGEGGKLSLLATSTGNDLWSGEVDRQLASVALDAADFARSGNPGEARDLRTSLNEVALDPDNRLVPARGFAIRILATLEDPEITRDLLDLYGQRAMPAALREDIGEALRQRRSGSEHLIAALDQHYDYLEDTKQ